MLMSNTAGAEARRWPSLPFVTFFFLFLFVSIARAYEGVICMQILTLVRSFWRGQCEIRFRAVQIRRPGSPGTLASLTVDLWY